MRRIDTLALGMNFGRVYSRVDLELDDSADASPARTLHRFLKSIIEKVIGHAADFNSGEWQEDNIRLANGTLFLALTSFLGMGGINTFTVAYRKNSLDSGDALRGVVCRQGLVVPVIHLTCHSCRNV